MQAASTWAQEVSSQDEGGWEREVLFSAVSNAFEIWEADGEMLCGLNTKLKSSKVVSLQECDQA